MKNISNKTSKTTIKYELKNCIEKLKCGLKIYREVKTMYIHYDNNIRLRKYSI